MTFGQLIKEKFTYGGWSIRIIVANIIIFLLFHLFHNLDNAFTLYETRPFYSFWIKAFILPGDFYNVLMHPWTIFTHMFAQYDFLHLAFNMLWLYFGAELFRQFLGNKRLIYVYFIGGLFGAFTQVFAQHFIPFFYAIDRGMLGASAAVSAVFVAIAYYRPMHKVSIFGLFELPIVFIAAFMVISDFIRLTDINDVAHIAHLGGAAFGVIAISGLKYFDRFIFKFESIFHFFKGGLPAMRSKLFMRKQKVSKVKHFHKADEQYFETKQEIQNNIDAILDKIKRKGYDGLSKTEKDYLFNQKDKI